MTPSLPGLGRPIRTDQLLVVAALALVVLGCFFVLKPFLSALLWAVILTFSSWPAYRRLLGWVGGRRSLAAFLMTLGITAVLLVPSMVIVLTLAGDVKALASTTVAWFRQGPPAPPSWVGSIPWVGGELVEIWNDHAADSKQLLATMEQFVDPLSSWLLAIGKTLGHGVLELSVSIFISFFFFRDGSKLGERALAVATRLAGDRGDYLLRDVAGGTIRGVVYGILGTAMAQGLLAGVGFSIAGMPGAVLLGLLTFLVSVMPMGPPLIWLPASLWVFQNVSAGMGIFLFLWGMLVVSTVDNFIRPLIISQGNKMPFILIFMGVLGGGLAFGLIGIFLGPTLLAVTFRLGEEWLAHRRKPIVVSASEVPPPDPPEEEE